MFEKIKRFYKKGLWSKEQVLQAVEKGVLSAAQASEIIGESEG